MGFPGAEIILSVLCSGTLELLTWICPFVLCIFVCVYLWSLWEMPWSRLPVLSLIQRSWEQRHNSLGSNSDLLFEPYVLSFSASLCPTKVALIPQELYTNFHFTGLIKVASLPWVLVCSSPCWVTFLIECIASARMLHLNDSLIISSCSFCTVYFHFVFFPHYLVVRSYMFGVLPHSPYQLQTEKESCLRLFFITIFLRLE